MYITSLLIIVSLFISTTEGCSVNFVTRNDIIQRTGNGNGASGLKKKKEIPGMATYDKKQFLFVYNWFNCSGNITEITFAALWNGRKSLQPEFQIWRPSSATLYTKITGSSPTISNSQTNSIYTYTLNPPMAFEQYDVLGLYQPDKKKSSLLFYLYEDTQFYHYFSKKATSSLSSINTDEFDRKDEYPMVSVSVGEPPVYSV
jgi:hypothetical protein